MSRLLVVEDEQHLAEGLRFNLEAEGYEVDLVGTGEAALQRLLPEHSYDALILDIMLPGVDGFSVAAQVRSHNDHVPILMLTARGRAEDVLKGLESGADDYLPKPFDLQILLARVHGLLRRLAWARGARPKEKQEAPPPEVFQFDGKRVDFAALEVHGRSRTYRLTQMEADLLRHLIKNAGRVVSRKQILEEVWGLHVDTDTRAIDNFIVRLRRYIEDEPAHPKHLLTVRGIGYRFVPEKTKT
jgi:two-component system, OmpR family, alkaline phosphatase synthesis response regulator PhoP